MRSILINMKLVEHLSCQNGEKWFKYQMFHHSQTHIRAHYSRSNAFYPTSHYYFSNSGDIRWTVVSSDISNSDEKRENLVFCDFQPATWYQLKVSATNDAGKTTALYDFATTKVNGGNYFNSKSQTIRTTSEHESNFDVDYPNYYTRLNLRRNSSTFQERVPMPDVFPGNELSNNLNSTVEQGDWIPTTIVCVAIISSSLIV